jgi:hypothetical protein
MNYKFCLFVYSRQSNFSATWGCHHYWWQGCKIRPILNTLMALRIESSFFFVSHLLWHRTSVYMVSSEGPAPTSHCGIRTGDARITRFCASTLATAPQGWVIKYKILSNHIMTPSTVKLQLESLFMPPRSKIGFFFPVCHSVLLSYAKNFNLAFTFHLSVSCDKTFPWVPKKLTLLPWPWCLTYLIKTLTLAISFEWYVLRLWYFTCVFLVTWPFCGYKKKYDLVTLTLVLDLHLKKTFTLAITFEW